MTPTEYHLLLVEDDASYSAYIRDELAQPHGRFTVSHTDTLAGAMARMRQGGVDAVLLDLTLPDSDGLDTLYRLQATAPEVPVVILSGTLDQALAMAAVQAGAQDYLVKSDIHAPVVRRVVRYAIERRGAEARFHERDARYRSIVESSLDAIVSIDADGRIVEFNPAAVAMFDWPRAEAVGQDLASLIIPERLRKAHRQALARHRDKPETAAPQRRLEFMALRSDGSEFPIELTISKIFGAAGPVFTAFIRDLSERRRAEETQRISDERFRLLSAATNDTIWDWNIETNQLWWNENFETLFGYSREDVTPSIDAWLSHMHPEDVERVTRELDRVVAGGTRFAAEYRFRRKSGEYAFVLDRGQVIRDENGAPVRMIGGVTDLTERLEAQSRIAEQASLLDQARDAILVRNLDHRVTYYNRSAERLYGWAAEQVIGQSVRERFFPEPAIFDEAMRHLLQHGDWQGEVAVRSRDGAELIVESRWTLMRDGAGRPRAVLVIDTDVTERKELERRFLRAQRMESIGTLAGGIAHDLNNMLAPVLMSIELLKDNPTEEERGEILATIEASARRGAAMVRQVLTFARGVEGERTGVEVAELLKGVEKFANDTFMKNVTVRTNIEPDLGAVLGDVTQLHQVLINLCVNARDAMPAGGTLTLSAGRRTIDIREANRDLARAGAYVCIQVADTGTGIAPRILDRIFEPFFTSKPTGKGTGLGLSTSQAIVKSHGGFIRVETQLGKGSEFTVYLPAQTGPTLAETTVAATDIRRGAGELVLVVDDEEPLLRMTSLVLESFGYRVLLAANGLEAVDLFARHRAAIKVIITDMTMPAMDGATVIRKVREINPNARIIAVSGLGPQAAQVEGVMRFLPKPLTADTLLKAVSDVMGNPAATTVPL